jgi:hypothetical protein
MPSFATQYIRVKLSHVPVNPDTLSEVLDVLIHDLEQYDLYAGRPDSHVEEDGVLITVPVGAVPGPRSAAPSNVTGLRT